MSPLRRLRPSASAPEAADSAERRPAPSRGDNNAHRENNDNDDTAAQHRLRAKLRTYAMFRALAAGYLPSTVQAVAHLRALRASEAFRRRGDADFDAACDPERDLSPSGRALRRLAGVWLEQLAALLQHKVADDQIQDFVWYVTHAPLGESLETGVDTTAAAARGVVRGTGHASAAYASLETVGALLLTNEPFRLFLADLADVGREVFRDAAVSLADASQAVAQHVDDQQAAASAASAASAAAAEHASDTADPLHAAHANVADVAGEVITGAAQVSGAAKQSVAAQLADNDGGARDRLVGRLKQAVASLRQRPDYAQSVSILARLLQRYAAQYVQVTEAVVEEVVDEVNKVQVAERVAIEAAAATATGGDNVSDADADLDAALHSFWACLTTFGSAQEWHALEDRFRQLLRRGRRGAALGRDGHQADAFVRDAGRALEALLTEPSFFDDIDGHIDALRKQLVALEVADGSSSADGDGNADAAGPCLRDDMAAFFAQAKTTLEAAAHDDDVAALVDTSARIADLLWPPSSSPSSLSAAMPVNTDLLGDAASVFLPRLVQAIKYVPVPRLEVVSPAVDLLLENLVLEPGRAADGRALSFLPARVHIQVRNDVDVRIAATRHGGSKTTAAALAISATVDVRGLSIAAEDVGYVVRARPPLRLLRWLRVTVAGFVSLCLDERGIDVSLDIAAVRGAADRVLALRDVHVTVHHVDYTLRPSTNSNRRSWCRAGIAWLIKPIVRPLIRRALEHRLAAALVDAVTGANCELVFARERLRAARIASGGIGGINGGGLEGLLRIVRAVLARYDETPPPPPEVEDDRVNVSIGVAHGTTGVFDGVYAPGSLVRVWEEESAAAESINNAAYVWHGWRSDIFDVLEAAGEEDRSTI